MTRGSFFFRLLFANEKTVVGKDDLSPQLSHALWPLFPHWFHSGCAHKSGLPATMGGTIPSVRFYGECGGQLGHLGPLAQTLFCFRKVIFCFRKVIFYFTKGPFSRSCPTSGENHSKRIELIVAGDPCGIILLFIY